MSDLFGVQDYQIIGHLTACGQYPNYKARAQNDRKNERAATKHLNARARSVELPTRKSLANLYFNPVLDLIGSEPNFNGLINNPTQPVTIFILKARAKTNLCVLCASGKD